MTHMCVSATARAALDLGYSGTVVAAACAFLYGAGRIAGARLSVMLPAFAVLLYLGSARYIERPHVFSYLMAAVYLWLFFRYRDGGRERRWLYLMLPADVLWTNLHGGYVQGLAMVATFAATTLATLAWKISFHTAAATAALAVALATWPHLFPLAPLILLVGWPDTGALMRRLDDGANAPEGKAGNMYLYLGGSDEERKARLALVKAWVGEDAWKLNRWKARGEVPAITKEELERLRLKY